MIYEKTRPSSTISSWIVGGPSLSYENLTFTATGTISLSGNGTSNVSMFKSSGSFAWDAQAYCLTPFNAPCTLEFNKWSPNTDNTRSYAMIGWNPDPQTDASYSSIDYAAYPYATTAYEVYNNGTYILPPVRTWSRTTKFYIVYGTDGYIRHYNGSTQLYNVNYGNSSTTMYIDSSIHSVGATFGGFSNVRAIRRAWNGSSYV